MLDVALEAFDSLILYSCELVEEGLCVAKTDIGEELLIAEPRTPIVRLFPAGSVI